MTAAFMDLDAEVVELAPYCAPEPVPLRETAFRANAWLPDENERLRVMFFADEPIGTIAEALGRPFHGTRAQIDQLGLRRNSTRPWTDVEDAEIVRRYRTVTCAQLSLELGRSVAAVYARAGLLSVSEFAAPDYDGWEDAQIHAGFIAGVPIAQIAAMIGRPFLGVASRAHDLGLRHAAAPIGWSEAEVSRALALAHEGHRYIKIIEMLVDEGFPRRSKIGFGLKLRGMGYGRGWGRPWLGDEDEILRRAYRDGVSLTPVLQQLGRTKSSIRWRVEYLGLQGTHPKRDGFRQGPVWTPADDARLREAYGRGKVPTPKLAAELGRGRMAVCQRANVLGLVHGWCKPWTDDELLAIRICWARGMSLTNLARAVERDVAVVSKKAIKLGLSFNDPSRPAKAPRSKLADRAQPTLAAIVALGLPPEFATQPTKEGISA